MQFKTQVCDVGICRVADPLGYGRIGFLPGGDCGQACGEQSVWTVADTAAMVMIGDVGE